MLCRLLARLGAFLVRLDKPTPGPDDARYGFPEHRRWQPPEKAARPGWMSRRNPDRAFGPEADRF